MGWGWSYRPYVSVAQRREKAQRRMDKLRKQGIQIQGVTIEGRKIARTFWGQAWCQHLESFSDYENRLPRGRAYVRNGSVCHLEIAAGEIKAIVSGSELYDVKIGIKQIAEKKWLTVKELCSGKIGSLLELLQGRLSTSVMTVVTNRDEGLFPLPSEIVLDCSCPDWADMCKHVAAVLYGVGARLDDKPELLFLLRGVDHEELIEADAAVAVSAIGSKRSGRHIAETELEDVFGIEMLTDESSSNGRRSSKHAKGRSNKSELPESSNRPHNGIDTGNPPIKRKTSTSQPTKREAEVHLSKRPADAKTRFAGLRSKDLVATGKTVRELRARLELSQSELALIIGVSAATVRTWERKRGRLNLQQRTMSALNEAGKLTRKQVLRLLAKA